MLVQGEKSETQIKGDKISIDGKTGNLLAQGSVISQMIVQDVNPTTKVTRDDPLDGIRAADAVRRRAAQSHVHDQGAPRRPAGRFDRRDDRAHVRARTARTSSGSKRSGDVKMTEVDRITIGRPADVCRRQRGIQRRRARDGWCACSSGHEDGLPAQRRQRFDVLERRLIRSALRQRRQQIADRRPGRRHVLPAATQTLNGDASHRQTSQNRTAAARLSAASASTCSRAKSSACSGPNGAGKTTTFYMTVGLTSPDSGRVIFNGEDVTDLPMYARARKGIGYLPQEPSIFRGLTVEQNIMAILETLDLDAGGAPRALQASCSPSST